MQTFSVFVIPALIVLIPLYGLIKKVRVYEEFVEGAKDGFKIAVKIIPYLVAILFAIGMFRASGAMAWIIKGLNPIFSLVHFPAQVLPMAIMRPLTGSGSVGVLAEMIKHYGINSIYVTISAIMFGSTETTFYVLAVYFGAVNIRDSRYAVQTGLIADFASIVAAVIIGFWLYH